MDLWELKESVQAESSRLSTILSESGRRVRGRNNDPAYLARLAEFAGFLADIMDGRRPTYWLQEAMSTSDFPILMGDILDRQLLARYREWPVTWTSIAKRGTVRDFRTVRRIAVDGLEGRYYPSYAKPELSEPQERNDLAETGYTYAVEVYEKAVSLNWKMLVNDDLDAFRDIPDRLARGARRTEEYFVTQLFVDANGPHASLYTAGNKNIVNVANGASANNPALSISGLQDAMKVLAAQKDANNEPIFIEAVVLVVPPALEITARNILNATEIRVNEAGGVANQQLIAQNWMRNRVTLVVNPYIPVVASTANGNTSWFLFAAPSNGRPALEVGFLAGFEEPGLFQKAPNTMRVGGGIEALYGDFDTNELRWKGVHVFGGTRLDPKATVASNGSGA